MNVEIIYQRIINILTIGRPVFILLCVNLFNIKTPYLPYKLKHIFITNVSIHRRKKFLFTIFATFRMKSLGRSPRRVK